MQSRMERYGAPDNKKYERTTKNTDLYKKVYDDIYSDTSYKNMSILDTPREININKLKNILDDKYDNKRYRTLKDYSVEDISLNDKIEYPDNNSESYDINKIIDDAKSKRAFIEEAKEKQKYLDNIQTRNSKYQKKYEDLEGEEKELEDLINTMTISVKKPEDDLMADLMGDENTIVTKPVTTDFDVTSEQDETGSVTNENETDKLNKVDKTFYTDSNMITKNDFEDFSAISKELNRSKKVTRVIIIIIILLLIAAAYFVATKYFLK